MAQYDLSRLRVAKGEIKPRAAHTVLPPSAAAYLKSYEHHIELSASELEAKLATEALPTPYWDKTLATDRAARLQLYKVLFNMGVLTLRTSAKARCAVFFFGA